MSAKRSLSVLCVLVAALAISACSGGNSSNNNNPISVTASASNSTVDGSDSVTLTASVTNDKNAAGVTWTVSGGGALTGSTTTATTYTAPAATSSKQTITVTATSVADATKSSPVTLTVQAAPAITTSSLASGTVGTTYSASLAASGGVSPYTYSVSSGTLPAGLSLSSSGTISGTPTSGGVGTANVTFKVTDSGTATALSATQQLGITVAAAPAISFTTTTLAAGTINAAYSATVTATGGAGALTFSVASGALPTGLNLSTSGTISGTPTATGTANFSVKATDAFGDTMTQSLSIAIDATLAVTTSSLPTGYQNSVYTSTTLAASGGTGTGYTWSWAAAGGSVLPAGLNLSAGGVITGTPTASGTSTVAVTVKDSANNSASANLSITIQSALSITTASPLKAGVATVAYSQAFAATGGTGTGYTWSVTTGGSSLTALSLSLSNTGVLTGTPAVAGNASFTVQVMDSASHTASTVFTLTVDSALVVTTASLPAATSGTAYSQTLAAGGGSGTGYTWAVTGVSNLASFNLSLSTAGVLTGTPTTTGTAAFTAQVTDSFGDTATMPLTVLVYSALSLPTANPVSLPGTGNVGTAYNGTITASGGSGTYTWQVTGLSDGLTSNAAGNTLTISGTPTTQTTVTFNVKLTDTVTNLTTTQTGYKVVVGASLSLTLPAANPTSLPSATINQAYSGSISATGGVGPYTWTINGAPVTAGGLALTDGLTATNSGSATLTVTGTPTTVSTVTLTSVQVTDSTSATATATTYTIAVNNPPSQVSGQIMLNNNCGGTATVPTITVSINTTPVQTTTTDSNGNYAFAAVNDGSYTVTPSITGPSSVFYPATQNITVAGASVAGNNFNVALGYSVSGSVSYAGADTGRIYLNLVNSSCGGNGALGTSIPFSALGSGGAFTINGVPPGSYTLSASLDNLGQGAQNTTNPTANTSVSVSNANVTGVAITPADPTLASPTATPNLKAISPTDSGVAISFKPITNTNGVEAVQFYTLQWSTDSGFSTTSSVKMAAIGTGTNEWIVTNNLSGVNFTDGTAYYFRARGETTAGPGPWTIWGGGTPLAVTVNAPSGFNTVSGAVTIPSDITPSGPLYVGFYDQNSNNVYATMIPVGSLSNSTGNPYSVSVPNGSTYVFFAILDQNSNGLIDAGDATNVNSYNSASVTISGPVSNENLTLPDSNSTTAVMTQFFNDTSWNGTSANTFSGYNLNFNERAGNKLPVAVQLVSASNPNVVTPVDIGNACQGCGHPQFDYFASINSDVPNIGDTYTFQVTYSDGTSVSAQAAVTNVIPSADAPSNFYPTGASGGNVAPTFTWYDWSPTSTYNFYFQLTDNNGNTIWQIPSSNSNSNGFSSSILSIAWPTDPTDPTNLPTVPLLTSGNVYNWSITTQDSNGNSAQTQWYILP